MLAYVIWAVVFPRKHLSMKRSFLCLALLAAPLCAIPPTTTVTFHNTTLGDVATIVFDGKIELAEQQGLSPGYHAIDNLANVEFGGTSHIGFTRFRKNVTECDYFFRASTWDSDPFEAGYQAIEVWETVYWAAEVMGEPGTLVDGAQWGSDNYVLMLDENEGKLVAVLQFYFDQNDYTATLIGAAVNLDGLTFMEGVLALQAIPEPSTYAAIFGAVALGAVVIVRRRQSKQG